MESQAMKSIGAAIVIAAGLATLVAGTYIHSSHDGVMVSGAGAIVAVLGIIFWIRSLNQP